MSELPNKAPRPLLHGEWPDASWELYAVEAFEVSPPQELRKTVMLLPFRPDGKVVLMRAARGWGLIGGHHELVEATGVPETDGEALAREAVEELGALPRNPELFAIRKIINTSGSSDSAGRLYPLESYMMLYRDRLLIDDDAQLAEPTGHEVLERRSFAISEVDQLALSDPADLAIIQLAADGYRLN